MEVKGRLITAMGLGAPGKPYFHSFLKVCMDVAQLDSLVMLTDVQGCQDGKLQAERVSELQERKQSLQSLLNSRLGELRQVCLHEAVREFITLKLLKCISVGCCVLTYSTKSSC